MRRHCGCRADVLRRQGLELKHRAARQQGVIYIKVGILGGGSDEGDGSLFHTFQKALLLALVEVLNLVQIQKDTACRAKYADIRQHRLDITGGGRGAVELVQLHTAARCNDAGHGGFAHAGGAIENHIGNFAAFDGAAENLILAE